MNTLRLISSLVFLGAAAPALAGNFGIARIPLNGVLAPADNCPHAQAVGILERNAMTVVATVPDTSTLHRYVVDFKSDLFAVTVGRSDCRIDIVDYAERIHPYCAYIPGLVSSCRVVDSLAQ
jgi:hypothetical protein